MNNVKLKRFISIYTGNSISDGEKDNFTVQNEKTIPYISTKDIDSNTNKVDYFNDMYIDVTKNTKFKIANKGDILLCVEGGSAGKKIAKLDYDVCFVNKLCCFKCNEKFDNEFLYYYLQSDLFLSQFYLNMTGLIGGVSQTAIKEFKLPYLSKAKQIIIAKYLSKKIKKVDENIEKNKKIIDLLEEYKISFVSNIIKQEKCEYGRLKKYMYEINEKNNDENAQLLSVFTKIGVDLRENMEDRGNKASTVMNYKIVKKDDMIVNKLLAWMGAFGVSSYNGVTSPDYDVFRFRDGSLPQFYHYYFRYTNFKNECYKNGHGIMLMRWRTYSSELLNIEVPHPSFQRQNELTEIFKKKFILIEKSINKRQQLIIKLEEYKKSLIYEAITGTIEV